jgi:glycosyltransferase involved in cell wall biosynthesis
LEEAVKEAGLTGSFYFEGFKSIEEIPKYTGIADVLVGCLTKSELLEATIPAKVMSYLAAGKPLVLAMDGEVHNLINNVIRCGHVGPTEDAAALAKNIARIRDSSAEAKEAMGERARNYHFKYFERNIILTKLHEFIFD